MTDTPTDDMPGFAAEEPVHCHDCYRLIRPGQAYFLTIEDLVLCPDCIGAADAIRLSGGLTVKVREGRLLIHRGSPDVEVFPREVRHLVAYDSSESTGAEWRGIGMRVLGGSSVGVERSGPQERRVDTLVRRRVVGPAVLASSATHSQKDMLI